MISKAAAASSAATRAVLTGRAGPVGAIRPTQQQHQQTRPVGSHGRGIAASAVASGERETATLPQEPGLEAVQLRDEGPATPRSINDAPLQLKFVVPNAVAGAVLGRGGATVSRIKAATGCYVQITRAGTAVPDARERMLILAGEEPAALKEALRLVMAAIEAEGQVDRLRWLRRHPGRVFLQQVIPATCAGKVMGPEGEQIKAIGARTGCSVVVEAKPRNAAFVPFRLVNYLADTPGQVVAAAAEVLDAVLEEQRYRPGIAEIGSICMRIISIPQRRVGNLLGPSGQHIKSLQEVLRVKIGVADPVDRSGNRHVTLWGAPQNVRVAADVVMLAAGSLPQELEAGARSSRSSSRGDDDSSVAGSVATTELVCC